MFDAGVEVTTQSGASRFCNSIIGAICVAPLLLVCTTLLLAYNEKRDVCDSQAIEVGHKDVTKIGCDKAQEGDGKLVFFTCDLADAGIDASTVDLGAFRRYFGDYIHSTGLRIKSEMRVCVEKSESKSKKGTGGQTVTETVYTYEQAWSSTIPTFNYVNYRRTRSWRANCNKENPPWPSDLPKSHTVYAESAQIGAYRVENTFVKSIPLGKKALNGTSGPRTYVACDGSEFHFCSRGDDEADDESGAIGIGFRRVSFFGCDFDAQKTMTVLGKNSNGKIGMWTTPGGTLCSGQPIGELKLGTVTKDDFFTQMQQASTATTWLLRIVGFCLAWIAFKMIASPLGIIADCIPCIGPCIGDMVEAVACFISVFPACGCTLIVVGVVWIGMRPLYGAGLLLVAVFIFGSLAFFKFKSARNKISGMDTSGLAQELEQYDHLSEMAS